MCKTVISILENQNMNIDDYEFINKTADNIKLVHIKSGQVVNIRW